jgi:ribosomal protein S6
MKTDFKALTALCKHVSMIVVEDGGIVQSIQNHGIREFPHRFQAKYPDYLTQQRYYEKGRWFSIWYEASPQTQSKVSTLLERQSAENVLRYTHLQSKSKLDFLNLPDNVSPSTYKHNPYVKRVLKQQQQQQDAAAAAAETGTAATASSSSSSSMALE